MKEFKQSYTTADQSIQLHTWAGVSFPRSTADLHYTYEGDFRYSNKPQVGAPKEYMDLPCWSFGRIVEIILEYSNIDEISFSNKEDYSLESLITLVKKEDVVFNFPKLEK